MDVFCLSCWLKIGCFCFSGVVTLTQMASPETGGEWVDGTTGKCDSSEVEMVPAR